MLIYGKRRIAFSLLLGFLLGFSFKTWLSYLIDPNNQNLNFNFIESYFLTISNSGKDSVIGHIIPGLIANWMDRQGAIRTLATVLIISSIVLLIMMLFYGGYIQDV